MSNRGNSMLYLNAEDIRKIFSMRDAIESDKEAFIVQAEGGAELPVRTNFHVTDSGITSIMPAFIKSMPAAGLKVVSTYPGNVSKGMPAINALVLLTDPETGQVCALLDGGEVTRLRTAAVSGAAAELLSNPDSASAALIGTGGQAAAQLEALLTVRRLGEVRIFDRDSARVSAFIDMTSEMARRFGARLTRAESSDEAVTDADIITTVTTSAAPVFDGRLVKKGAHINAVGAFLPEKRELDEYTVTHADRIFIDNWDAIKCEAGDFLIPIAAGAFSWDAIAGELGDLMLGKAPGRTNREEITIMKTVGFGTLDIAAAHNIYKKALKLGAGRQL